MPLPPWTVELIRRGISDVARKASEPETLEKLKTQATEILQDLPETAARGLDAVMRKAEAGKESVQRWTRKQTAIAIPMVNASGVLMHADGIGVPVAQSTIDAGYELLRGDCVRDSGQESKLKRKLSSLLSGQGDYVVAVASSFPAALTAFSQLVQERPLVIHRSHAVRLPGGLPLPDAFGTLLPVIQEVGSIGDVAASDYDSFDKFCDIVADVGTSEVTLLDFGDRDAVQAVVLPVATLATMQDYEIPSAESYLAKGADFVVMPGNGVCGGPDCGLLIGRRAAIETITSSPAWPALVAQESTQAMLVAAMESAASDADSVPVQALVATSVENLSSRAQRMATRLGGSDVVAECQVTTDDAKITSDGRWSIPSRQLRLRHQTISAQAWAEQLAGEVPAVIVAVDNDQVVVDLRWVDTSRDNQLAKSIGGQLAEEATA